MAETSQSLQAGAERPSRFQRLSPREAWIALAALAVLLVAGIIAGHNLGRIVERLPLGASQGLNSGLGQDLKFYRTMIEEVRSGQNYYDVAHRRLPEFGYPVGSMFNWRLPTYAYLGALLPGDRAIQGLLVALSLAALLLAFTAEREELGFARSAILVVLLIGALRWCIDGQAYYAHETWVAPLLAISASALALREQLPSTGSLHRARRDLAWTALALLAGLAALFIRELVLPYCVAACGIAWWQRRKLEASLWLVGIVLFFLFLAWHGAEIASRVTPAEKANSRGPLEWIQMGGMNFVLMTARMNTFIYNVPGWLLFAYVFFSLVGLADSPRPHCTLLGIASLLFIGAFCIVGMDMNFYWGLIYAPLLPFGLVRAPQAIATLFQRARGSAS